MKRSLFILVLFYIIVSCNKRTVQLPETDSQSITTITDISPAYFFYNELTKDVEFNRNNLIGTTHWLVNIDKRLTMEQLLPDLRYLQQKRRKDGLHTNANAKNYFSCSNPNIQNLAFIEFTDVNFREDQIKDISEIDLAKNDHVNVCIKFRSDTDITIEKNSEVKRSNTNNLVSDLHSIIANDDLRDQVFLNFYVKISFQDYITFKSELLKVDQELAEISKEEFVFN